MAEQIIVCPNCKERIPLTQAITQRIEEDLREKMAQELHKRDQELTDKERTLAAKEEALARSERQINKRIEQEVAKKIIFERDAIEKEARKMAEIESILKLKSLKEDLESKDSKLKEAQKEQLSLLKQNAQLEEKARNIELEIAKRMNTERAGIYAEACRKIHEEHQLKDKEKDKNIADLLKQIEELKRRAEQGSQQSQGEILEIELEQMLRSAFPCDIIEPVSKGVRGADILQKVHSPLGQYCGTIIWESKNTKAWSDNWIDKLKENQREAKAEIAVLMSLALPKEVNNFTQIEGVWITNYSLAVALAVALRVNLIEVNRAKQSIVGKGEKMEAIYNYLAGAEFRQKIEAIVEAFVSMKQDLDREKMVTEKLWAKREKQITKVINNTVKMYGDMQGIIGASLPEIKSLELKALVDDSEFDDTNEIES